MARALLARYFQIVILAFTIVVPCFAQESVKRLDEIAKSFVESKQFMGSVLIARGDKVVFSKGYGSANLEWSVPNDSKTKFRLGSLTKQFTAACVLLLEERGKLKVEEPISKYFPEAPAAWSKITIFNVLTHTAGIPNFTSFPDYPKLQPFPTTAENTISSFINKPLDFEPGEKMSYSNSGYVLLGALIGRVSDMSYEEFVQENIFKPLGMNDSGYDSNSTIITHRASGYVTGPHGPMNAGFIHMSVPDAAGALYSTTEDLLRWERGLFGGRVVSASSLKKMITPFKNDYGFGLVISTVRGRKVIWHNGGIEGFNTVLAYYPESQITIAVLANLNGHAPEQIAAKFGGVMNGDPVKLISERKEAAIPEEILKRYMGIYSLAPNVNITIRLEDGRLTAQISGQAKIPLFPESDKDFFARTTDAQVEFISGESGTVPRLILRQTIREMTAIRITDNVAE